MGPFKLFGILTITFLLMAAVGCGGGALEDVDEAQGEAGAEEASQRAPVKKLKVLPQMPGITEETAEHLKWKSFKYMVSHDHGGRVRRQIFKFPLRYALRYLKSVFKKRAYVRDGDFFLYTDIHTLICLCLPQNKRGRLVYQIRFICGAVWIITAYLNTTFSFSHYQLIPQIHRLH